jgi:hypothetical protein
MPRKPRNPDLARGKPESLTQRQVGEYLRRQGCKIARTNSGTAYRGKYRFQLSAPGWADWTGCAPDGRFIGVECKAPGGKPTPDQVRWITEILSLRAIAFWCDSVESCQKQFCEAMGWAVR